MLQTILSIKDKVKTLLEDHPHLRDDDNKLIANIWHHQTKGMGIDAFDLLKLLSKGKLISTEAICRARRKVQETYPETRGKKYYERHKEAQNVRHSITSM